MNTYIWLRGSCYVVAAAATVCKDEIVSLATSGKINNMQWSDWALLLLAVIIAAAINLRAFVDQSYARSQAAPPPEPEPNPKPTP